MASNHQHHSNNHSNNSSNNNNHHSNPIEHRKTWNEPSIVVRGRVLRGDDLRDYAERNGLCARCGVYQTHKKKGSLLKPRFEPLTVTNALNEITVYKGYCIAPTCYSLERAKQLLGEIPVRRQRPCNVNNVNVALATTEALMGVGGVGGGGGGQQPSSHAASARRQPARATHSEENLLLNAAASHTAWKMDPLNHYQQQQQQQVARNSGGSGGGGEDRDGGSRGSKNIYGGESSSSSQHHTLLSAAAYSRTGPQQEYPLLGSNNHYMHTSDAAGYATMRTGGSSGDSGESGGSGSGGGGGGGVPSFYPADSRGSLTRFSSEYLSPEQQQQGGKPGGGTLASDSPPIRQSHGLLLCMPPLSVDDQTPTTTVSEPSESDDPLIRTLQEKIGEGNYLEFINLLDHREREPGQLLEGFRLLRYHVVRDHAERPEGVVLVGDNWVKVINERIQAFQEQNMREVVISGLVTLSTISRQGTNYPYKRSLVRKNTMEMTMKLFDQCRDDDEIMDAACSLVVSLSLYEKNSLNAKSFPRLASLVRKLAFVVLSDGHCGKGLALRALFHISNQRKKAESTGKTAIHDVRNALGNEPSIRAILDAIRPNPRTTPPAVVEAGLSLLWKLCWPREDDKSRFLGASVENIGTIVQILENASCVEVIETACGVLTNMALDAIFPEELAHRMAARICHLMNNHPEYRTREVASVAVHAFCNLLANPSTRKGVLSVGSTLIMSTTLSLFQDFPEEEGVVEYCCLAASHVAFQNPEGKQFLSEPDTFFHCVRSAFDTFVASRGLEASLPVKDATLCCFASISGCTAGGIALTESGLIERLRSMHADEQDVDSRHILGLILQNTSAAVQGKNSDSGGSELLRQQPSLFVQLIRNATSEEDVLSMIQELRIVGEAGLPALGNHGFDELKEALTRFAYSSAVQREGCYLLAEIYYRMPLDAVESPTQLPDGSWAIIHRKNVVDLLCSAISSHPEAIETQIASMMALLNLLSPLCSVDLSSPNVVQIQGWLAPVWTVTMAALTATLQTPIGNESLLMAGLPLCWMLSILSSEEELQNWGLTLLQHVFDTMSGFASNEDLNLVACDILLQMKENHACADFMVNSPCVAKMVHLLDGDNVEFALRASAILSTLTTKLVKAIDQLLQIPYIIRRLMACMNSMQAHHHIVLHICVILEALINFHESGLRRSIVDHGAIAALCRAICIHQSNATLCTHACRVISLLLPGLDSHALGPLKSSFGSTFLPLVMAQNDNPESEAVVLDLLSDLVSIDEYFKQVLQIEASLQIIVQAMSRHLGSAELQRSGCGLLLLLSSNSHGKQLIGNVDGIQAILNAMLAHNESISIQNEGLKALKNLATEASNKPLLAELDCVGTVTISLRIHYDHPLVISGAFSALNNIAIDSTTNTVALMPPEIFDIVLSAMRRFPNDEALQNFACFYLKSCTYLPDNRERMKCRLEELLSVLQQAMKNVPQFCHERAQSIMKKLQR